MALLRDVEGAGNRFVLMDARDGAAPADPIALGLELCAEGGAAFDGAGADGLLLLEATPNAAARLIVVNRDGTRPEMCGNGLRCVAAHLFEGRDVTQDAGANSVVGDSGSANERTTPDALDELIVVTDVGPLPCRRVSTGSGQRVAVRLGAARIDAAFSVEFPGAARGLPAFAVDVGNPHAVLDASHLGVRLADAPLADVAAATLATGRFPHGVNVELVEVHGDHVRARVFERGVGETAACGTGAGAIAAVAFQRLDLGAPLRVHMPGGILEVDEEGPGGELWLSGPVSLGPARSV